MAHARLSSNCTTTTTGAEECNLTFQTATAGALVEVLEFDPAGAIDLGDETTSQILLTTDGVDMNLSGENILKLTSTGTTSAIFRGDDADGDAATIYDTTGTGSISIGSDDVSANYMYSTSGTHLVRLDTGTVNLYFKDYGDTDADQVHGAIIVDCTTETSGAEDCDMDFQTTTDGAAASSALFLDADGPVIATKNAWKIRLQNGAAPDATCLEGEIFIDTDETDDTNCTTAEDNSICLCVGTNTWVSLENN